MKYLLVLILLFSCSEAFSDNCILDKNNNVVAKINYQPDLKDLDSRGEAIVKCDNSIKIGDADFRNNKVVKHVFTQDEIQAKAKIDSDNQVKLAAKASAISKLKAIGLSDDEIKAILP